MSISSRTPEGQPLKCPLCGQQATLEVSPVTGDATCSACGQLLWEHRDLVIGWRRFVSESLGVDLDQITLDTSPVIDSLDAVEMIMELEEEFAVDLDIPPEEARNLRTLGDILRWLAKRRREES